MVTTRSRARLQEQEQQQATQAEVEAAVEPEASTYASELQEERNAKAKWRPKQRRFRRPEEAYDLYSGRKVLEGLEGF